MTKVFQTYSFAEAQCKIHITERKEEADLWVYLVANQGCATKNGFWYITNNRANANVRAYFCSRAMAELIIYFVSSKSQAGWKKTHRLKHQL